MASTARTLADRLITVLRAIDGTGSYTYDLTDDSDRVNYRDGGPAMSLPCLDVVSMNLDSEEGQTLRKYGRTLTINVMGYAGASADTPGAYMLAASDLANDIHLAIEAERINSDANTIGRLCYRAVVRSDVLDGASVNVDGCGVVYATIELKYRLDTGA